MNSKLDQLVNLRERLSLIYSAMQFQILIVDHNIMVRKLFDSNLPANYKSPIFCDKLMGILPAIKLCDRKPVVLWDIDHLRIEDHLDKFLTAINDKEGIWFLTSATLDKFRLVPLIQQGAAGFLLKPYTVEVVLEKIKEKLG